MITSTHVRLGKQLESCIEEVWQITAGELPLLSPSSQINYHISCWHHDSSLFGGTLGQQNVLALAHWHRILDGFYCRCVAAFYDSFCNIVKIISCAPCTFFQRFAKNDIWSHLVNAWKNKSPLDFYGPRLLQIAWTRSSTQFCPLLNSIHNFLRFSSGNRATDRTTTFRFNRFDHHAMNVAMCSHVQCMKKYTRVSFFVIGWV